MKNLIKKEILVLLIILTFILLSGCINRNMPPEKVFDELGADDYIVTMGLPLNDAKDLLDEYDIDNNYVVRASDVQVFVVKNQDSGVFYCIFAPHNIKYDIVIFEIPLVDFSVIEEEIEEYSSQEDSIYDIDLCTNYCGDLGFTSFFNDDRYQNNQFIDELSYPIILTIGSVVNQHAIFIGFYETGEIVVFTPDSEGSLDILFTIEV
ncbi:MAG: hypothetical protein PF513_01325 [Tenericutes bacterium]|jgi:hypothetical protein|nr:hypothetical protein [Mycoplasmatota bacterium]